MWDWDLATSARKAALPPSILSSDSSCKLSSRSFCCSTSSILTKPSTACDSVEFWTSNERYLCRKRACCSLCSRDLRKPESCFLRSFMILWKVSRTLENSSSRRSL